jgi:hypothetical protein
LPNSPKAFQETAADTIDRHSFAPSSFSNVTRLKAFPTASFIAVFLEKCSDEKKLKPHSDYDISAHIVALFPEGMFHE